MLDYTAWTYAFNYQQTARGKASTPKIDKLWRLVVLLNTGKLINSKHWESAAYGQDHQHESALIHIFTILTIAKKVMVAICQQRPHTAGFYIHRMDEGRVFQTPFYKPPVHQYDPLLLNNGQGCFPSCVKWTTGSLRSLRTSRYCCKYKYNSDNNNNSTLNYQDP